MAGIEYTFKRYEKKFLLSLGQYEEMLPRLKQQMEADGYGLHTICNIYFDTDNFDLIRTSIEKPPYKEKFRLRSYGTPGSNDNIFAEIKKKFNGIVYKRRIALRQHEINDFFNGGEILHENRQIQREIHWFFRMYNIEPKVFIGYERIAFAGRDNPGLRITFDKNIRWRTEELDLYAGDKGQLVMEDNKIVMEIKFPQAAPLWLASLLSEFKVYPHSFSKYGTCYKKYIIMDIAYNQAGEKQPRWLDSGKDVNLC
ncbi:MAG: polyphosphate polymerase domain-containing protein [Lachnospiraceae bacterium]|nr:polyphosphate polymerase domain-containing protein [Lachnospiraceae bacterium]